MRTLPVLLLLSLLLSSCQFAQSEMAEGEQINTSDRLEVQKLVVRIHNDLRQRRADNLPAILASELKTKLGNYTEEMQDLVGKVALDSSNFLRNVKLECLVTNGLFKRVNSIRSERDRYSFQFPAASRAYIYLFSISSGIKGEQLLVSNVFFKEKGSWKLGCFYIAPYSYFDLDAFDLYSEASKYFYDDQVVPAYLYSLLMTRVLTPGGTYLQYDIIDGMKEQHTQIADKLRDVTGIPFNIKELPGKPEVFELQAKLSGRKPHPHLLYKTSVPLTNTEALERENIALHAVIHNYLPNLYKVYDSVFYAAVNEYPNEYKEPEWVSFARVLEPHQ